LAPSRWKLMRLMRIKSLLWWKKSSGKCLKPNIRRISKVLKHFKTTILKLWKPKTPLSIQREIYELQSIALIKSKQLILPHFIFYWSLF
jgi:hypothetical protein